MSTFHTRTFMGSGSQFNINYGSQLSVECGISSRATEFARLHRISTFSVFFTAICGIQYWPVIRTEGIRVFHLFIMTAAWNLPKYAVFVSLSHECHSDLSLSEILPVYLADNRLRLSVVLAHDKYCTFGRVMQLAVDFQTPSKNSLFYLAYTVCVT